MSATIIAEGLPDLTRYLERTPAVARRAARLAINQVAERKALRAAREAIAEQVAFPRTYLTDNNRLSITRRATDDNLVAVVTGRQRPTSLARFAPGQAPGRRGAGVTVRVKPGRSEAMRRAFLIRLRRGRAPVTDESFNLGLAVRLRPGERVENKIRMVPMKGDSGLYLLYGPSVEQVFRSVAADISPAVLDDLATEFLRQFVRLSEQGGV